MGTKDSPAGHPARLDVEKERAADLQLRVADLITRFAGSMMFVYIHAALFAVWMVFFEKSPWQTLTLIVSLEAIFLSTFVMIGQNRQAEFARRKADHDYEAQELELRHNTQVTEIVHRLTQEIHAAVAEGRHDVRQEKRQNTRQDGGQDGQGG
ncbi:DUF1003 domain-containing protein [Actinomadura rupiterrae]|uniref:DUF1003 domain-containing protein n=1 Tax=Actinomadura rupiterrae TaxID=559627 RepID=UPI0020A588A8|nr:DUF1003 domain-containing protein [Actinomadura rupiterrae]MCP2341474.1 putative membrane protein [Actinomadura rupiterrae]